MKGENVINQLQSYLRIDEVIPNSDDEAVYDSVEIDVQGKHLTSKDSTVEGFLSHEPSRRSPLEKQVLAKYILLPMVDLEPDKSLTGRIQSTPP